MFFTIFAQKGQIFNGTVTYSTLENRKREYHHGILQIQIIFSTKFQFKLKILSFWTHIWQKGYFQS